MQLREWLQKHNMNLSAFARRVGVSPAAVSRYLREERMPQPGVMERIYQETRGKVGPADFYQLKRDRSHSDGHVENLST